MLALQPHIRAGTLRALAVTSPRRSGNERLTVGSVPQRVRPNLPARWKQPAFLPLNVKTAPSWRGIVPFTHLAREGRRTVTSGRRDLLAALGGAAAARQRPGLSLSETHARIYWWCSPPKIGTANV